MNRRNFVLLSAGGIAAISVPTYFYLTPDNAPVPLAMIWDTQTILDVGKKYRLNVPGESDQATLTGLLPTKELSDERILADFRADNTVLVDGWILSVTEARQCALFSITEA